MKKRQLNTFERKSIERDKWAIECIKFLLTDCSFTSLISRELKNRLKEQAQIHLGRIWEIETGNY